MAKNDFLERIADGRTDLIWEYLARNNDVAVTVRDGMRLIEWCAYYGDVSGLRMLLDRGETVTSLGDNLGLQAAAFHGYWQLCEFLLEQGANVHESDRDTGETPLHAALCTLQRSSHDLVIKVLLAHGADPHRVTNPGVETGSFMRDCRTKGETPLHRAAAFGSMGTINLLLGAGASCEVKDVNGDTPLAWASWYVRPTEILQRLCYGTFTIHPERVPMQIALLGKPHGVSALT